MATKYSLQDNTPSVLLVEAYPDIVDVTTFVLATQGYEVEHVPNVRQAHQYLNYLLDSGRALPALTLLGDLEDQLQDVAFLELLAAKADQRPRVILFSALPHDTLEEMAQTIRAVGIVVKPFDLDDLLRIVRATVGPGSRTNQTHVLKNRSALRDFGFVRQDTNELSE